MRKLRWIFALLLVAASLGACQKSGTSAPPPAAVANDPHALMQAEMEKASMDFSRVVVVRLTSEGKRVEVTSVMPNTIALVDVAGQSAKTIFAVNAAGNGVILFSRDILKASSFRTEMKFAELERKKGFTFPVVQADGSLQERAYVLEKIVIPQ
ncbi:MAG: hypothetical protein Q8O38_04220 [Sulfurimicrobium sp.]|nr:hypothetical protein [Sulfurimicrobium sp.]